MSCRNPRQAFVLPFAILLELPFQNAARCWPAQPLVRPIHPCQQNHIRGRVLPSKLAPAIYLDLHLSAGSVHPDQTSHLRHTQSADLADVASNLTSLLLALTGVLLRDQYALCPGIPFGPVLSTEFDPIAGLQKLADLAWAKFLGILHLQSHPAAACLPQFPLFQDHLVLET